MSVADAGGGARETVTAAGPLGRVGLVGVAVALAGCGDRIDRSAPESFVLRERGVKQADGVRLEYVSLVDAPAAGVYGALADVAHYPELVPGVDTVQVIATDGSFVVTPSPDGRRCIVRSTYVVREGEGQMQSVPIGVLTAATREAFLGAAAAIKRRAMRADP